MSVFIRRFTFDPGTEVLLEIESVNILDLDPPASISGIGTGTVLCVGEFENGNFAASPGVAGMKAGVVEVAGATDFVNTFGSLGYAYAGINACNPCARTRVADSAVTPETWNGNGFVQLSGKKFKRLLIARVDTSVGAVEFTRQAFLVGASGSSYNLEPGQTYVASIGGTTSTATFTATAGTVTTGAGTYNTTFAGGETLVLGYDDASNFTVTFLSADQTRDQVIARINAYAGFTMAVAVTSTTFSLTGIRRGSTGQVRIISGSGSVLTTLGMSAATTFGTGNTGNIDAVTFQEVKAVIEAAFAGTTVSQDANGNLRHNMTYVSADDWMTYASTSTAVALGFTGGQHASNSGYAYYLSGSAPGYASIANGDTLTLGFDDSANFVVTFLAGDTTQANIIARINGAAGYAMAVATDGTHIRFRGNKNGGEIRIVAASASVATRLAVVVATTIDAVALAAGTIPAGTVVQASDGTKKFVTMQDVSVTVAAIAGTTASGSGPYSVKVRAALDDGTSGSATAGVLVALERAIALGSFKTNNPATCAAALSESAIDAAYVLAIQSTDDPNGVSHDANVIFSARQSNAVRSALRTNAIAASSDGCFGRMAIVRPPLGTTKAVAQSSANPGVGATRDQRVIYTFPGANTFVPLIAQRGLAGGTGFTVDGNVDVGADGFMANVLSQLPPEENPGQATDFMSAVNGVESSANAQGLQIGDYKNFRAKGIAALRMDDGSAVFQSGVTSVDPGVSPELRNIARRRMADFIQDSLARRAKAFGKKLATFVRRKALTSEIRNFIESLLSRNNPNSQRIAGYTLDDKSGNTAESLAQGLYRIILKVRTLASLDSIVLQTTVGESVTVDEILPQAA